MKNTEPKWQGLSNGWDLSEICMFSKQSRSSTLLDLLVEMLPHDQHGNSHYQISKIAQ